ncbi:tetratricopeptide repeat protein, partial [Streptomyces sp. NPDC088725]|uniref:tetratricopeptide repeat protein n=1 Tax=Streptomyces sp. NPDC088725 TaxID=3365873 RepID=UPI00382B9840
ARRRSSSGYWEGRAMTRSSQMIESLPNPERFTHWQQTLGDHPNVLSTQLTLADTHQEAGAHQKALAVYRVALDRIEPTLGPENPLVTQIRARIDAAEHAASRSDR